MKKLSLLAIIGFAAALTACGDDSSSAGSSACLYKYSNGSQMCMEGDSDAIDALCLGSENIAVEKLGACPSGAKAQCPEMGVTSFYYDEGAACN